MLVRVKSINVVTAPTAVKALTDSKSRITREIQAVKKPESFMITKAKIFGLRANSFVVVEKFTTFSQF